MMRNVSAWLTVLLVAGAGCAGDDDDGATGGGGDAAEAGVSGSSAVAGSGGSEEGSAPAGGDGGSGGTSGSEPGGSGGSSGAGGSPTGGSDAGTVTDSGADAAPVAIVGGVPDTDYCRPVSDWDPDWSLWEQQALELVNERRAQGADCGTEGSFESSEPLQMDPMLRCSARLHAMDMAVQGYFQSQSPDGRTFMDRINDAGYTGMNYSENIGTNYASPGELIDGLMGSDGVCANLMNPAFVDAAVGFYEPENADGLSYETSRMWTIDLAAPRNPS